MKSPNVVLAALVATAFLSVAAFAQAPAAPAAAAAPTAAGKDAPATTTEKKVVAKPATPFVAKTAKSKECSLKADEQKLHGKARKEFRKACKKAV